MDETTGAINGSHTHGVYNGYGYNQGYGQDGILVDLINKNDLNSSIREVGRAVDISSHSTTQGIAGLAKGQSDGTVATSGLITDLGRDINNGVHNTLVQNLNSFNQLDKTVTNNANMIIGQGRDILAEMARCCCDTKLEMAKQHCDIKELVREENSKTRDLITSNRILDLQRELNDVKSDNSNLVQTNTIISALSKGNGHE